MADDRERKIKHSIFRRGTRIQLTAKREAELRESHRSMMEDLTGVGTVSYVFEKDGDLYVAFYMDGDETGDRWTQDIDDVVLLNAIDRLYEALDG